MHNRPFYYYYYYYYLTTFFEFVFTDSSNIWGTAHGPTDRNGD